MKDFENAKVLMLDLGRTMRGGQRQVLYLSRYLAEHQGPFPIIACPAGSRMAESAAADDLSVFPLSGHSPLNPLIYTALIQKLRRDPSIRFLHTHDANAAQVGAVLKCLFPHVRLIHSRRVSYAPRPGLHSWKYLRADMVVGVSRDIADQMVASGVAPARVSAIHSGIAPQTYKPHLPKSDGEPFEFLAIGALTYQKGFDVLLNAASVLARETLPAWKLRLVGDGPLAKSLYNQAKRLGLFSGESPLLHMPGRRESREVLPRCDAVLVPSTSGEGSSATIKEAWATGVPVIASDLSSNRELVKNGINGLLARTGDPSSLACMMKHCLLDHELRRVLVEGGNRSLPHFTHERMASSYLNLYANLL